MEYTGNSKLIVPGTICGPPVIQTVSYGWVCERENVTLKRIVQAFAITIFLFFLRLISICSNLAIVQWRKYVVEIQ